MFLQTAKIVKQEAALNYGSLEDINLRSMGSKINLKCALVIFEATMSTISQILMLILHEFITDKFLNFVRLKLLLTG